MEYLVRFSQSHESFRLAEIQALAALESIELEIVSYITDVGDPLSFFFLSFYVSRSHFAVALLCHPCRRR